MATSNYVGSYPPIGRRLSNQNQIASGIPTDLDGIEPQQNGAIYAVPLEHGAVVRSHQGDQLFREHHPYSRYLPNSFAQPETRHQHQQSTSSLQGSAFDMNTLFKPRRANKLPSPNEEEALISATTNDTQGGQLHRRPKPAESQQTLVDKGASPALENYLWEAEPPTVVETSTDRLHQATPRFQQEVPSQRDPGHDNHTSGHGYNSSTGRFEPDHSLSTDPTSPVIIYHQTIRGQDTGVVPVETSNQQSSHPQQRAHGSMGVIQYDNRQKPMHPQAKPTSNMVAGGSDRSWDQSNGRRPSSSSAPINADTAEPQQISVGQTPLNDIQQVRDQYKFYALHFHTLTQPQKEEMKILRRVIDAHEKSGSGRPQKNSRGPTRGSRWKVQHRQRQPQTISRPAAKRNVGHVEISSDVEDQKIAQPRPKKARHSFPGNYDTATYEELPESTTAMIRASQRDRTLRSTKLVGPRMSVQSWVDEQVEQTHVIPSQSQGVQDDEVNPSDSSSMLDLRPLHDQEPNIQHHRDGTRTEQFRLRPRETLIAKPFGRLAHFVPPDTILMVLSPEDDCGYVCPSGSTKVDTRTYMSLAAVQLGMIAAYQVKSLQEAMVSLEHIKLAVYDDRIGFQEPTAGINDEGRVASLIYHPEQAMEPPSDEGEESSGNAASNNGQGRVTSPPQNAQQSTNTAKLGNGTPMTPARQANSNPETPQKSIPIRAASLSVDRLREQDSPSAAASARNDQRPQAKYSHSKTPGVMEAEISVNESAMPKPQSHASISSLDLNSQPRANTEQPLHSAIGKENSQDHQSSPDEQGLDGNGSRSPAHPASGPMLFDGAYSTGSMNYGHADNLPQSDTEHSFMFHSQPGLFGDVSAEEWLSRPMPATEALNQDLEVADAAVMSTLENSARPLDFVQPAKAANHRQQVENFTASPELEHISAMSVLDRSLLQESDDNLMEFDLDMDIDAVWKKEWSSSRREKSGNG